MGIEKLRIELNNNPVDKDMVFASVGFGGGVLTKNYIINNKEKFAGSYAFYNVFFNYLKLNNDVVGLDFDVQRTTSTITFSAKATDFIVTLNKVLDLLFNFEYNEEKFLAAKEVTKNAFALRYKDVAFRARFKAYEFSDLNKKFNLIELIKDIENIDFDVFTASVKALIMPSNTCVYVVGDTSKIEKERFADIDTSGLKSKDTVEAIVPGFDPYLRQDAHLIHYARENYNLVVDAFDFLNPEVTVFTKRFVTDIFAEKLGVINSEVYADGADASIIFSIDPLIKKKDILVDISKEEYDAAHKKLVNKYFVLLNKAPATFAAFGVSLMLLGIYIDQYMSFVAGCNYEAFVEICKKADFKVSEAQLVFVEGER